MSSGPKLGTCADTEAVAVAGDWLEAQKLDIRVGRVVSAELHPDADRQAVVA